MYFDLAQMTASKVPTAPLTARSSSTRSRPPPRSDSPSATASDAVASPSKRRQKAKSASPRPQHVRPVDAVKLAKGELASKGIVPAVKAGRLRLTALPSGFDDESLVASALSNDSDVPMAGPLIHEGFYNLAAGVMKREPTLREKAGALQKHLERGLRRLKQERAEHQYPGLAKTAGISSAYGETKALSSSDKMQSPMLALTDDASATRGDTFITAHEEQSIAFNPSDLQLMPIEDQDAQDAKLQRAILIEAEMAEKELELCINTLEGYACETSKESRERNSLLGAAKGTAVSALGKLVGVINRQQEEAEFAASNRQKLEARLQQLEEENAGLRQMVQHMLTSEAQLQHQNQEQLTELNATLRELDEAEKRSDELAGQLKETYAELLATEEEKNRIRENVRDGANSPMMAFSAFVLGPDHIPRFGDDSKNQQQTSIGGGDVKKEKPSSKSDRLGSFVSRHEAAANPRRSSATPLLMAGMNMRSQPQPYRQNDGKPVDSLHAMPLPRVSDADKISEDEGEVSPAHSAVVVVPSFTGSASKAKKARYMDDESDSSEEAAPPSASPLASAFPALVPFLDFLTADPDADKVKAEGVTQNHEHLEKHMVQLQGERKKHMELNQSLQRAVDASLERLLVWVQAVIDSLRDFGPPQAKKDMLALMAVRDMLAWLGRRGCKDWIDPPDQLDSVLASHEEQLRAALTAAAESQPCQASKEEVEELRASLEQQTKHIEELEKRLIKAESGSQADPESKARGTPSSTGSGRAKSRDSRVGFQTGDSFPNSSSLQSSALAITERRVDEGCSQAELENESASKDSTGNASGLHDENPAENEKSPELEAAAASTSFASAAQKMRLYRSPFAQAIDLTLIPTSLGTMLQPTPDAQIAATESIGPVGSKVSDALGIRQLRSFMLEIYATKRLDDQRRDKAHQPRRPLHMVLQEYMRRQHGVKSLVSTKSWQLVQALEQHAPSDIAVCIFVDFLDGTRDLDELSFYLYCCSVLVSAVAEESQALPPSKLPAGYVSQSRAWRLVDIVFGHLPKAHEVVKAEIEQCIKQPAPLSASMSMSSFQFNDFAFRLDDDGANCGSGCLEVDELCRALLEGWRVAALLFERSMPSFSWRDTVLSFITTDVRYCGWLDQHEVHEAEMRAAVHTLSRSSTHELPNIDRTSLGEFVFRAVARIGGLGTGSSPEDDPATGALVHCEDSGVLRSRRRQVQEACLKIGVAAFTSLERSLGVYLSWLMHSEEPRDLAVYQGVKSRIYGFRCAVAKGECWPVTHNLRCLILLLLGHQFDLQLQRNETVPDHLAWELTALLQILRESWRRGASDVDFVESGPEFGAELDEVGEAVTVPEDSEHQSDMTRED